MNARAPYRHTNRVPLPGDEYLRQIGEAVFLFARYESTLIEFIEWQVPGYVQKVIAKPGNRPSAINTFEKFQSTLKAATDIADAEKDAISAAFQGFRQLIDRRNDLLHARPYTEDITGEQQIGYWGAANRHDTEKQLRWAPQDSDVLTDFCDVASRQQVECSDLLHAIRQRLATAS